MNRSEEYEALWAELNDLPPALDQTVARAEARTQKARRTRRGVTAALSSLAGVAAAFVLLVNVSLPFARACGKIPFLRELARSVAFSPSLSAAVENEYVQPIDQTQSAGGVTMTVRYLIVDNRQMILFYTLASDDPELSLECYPDLHPADGAADLPEHGLTYGGYPNDDGKTLRTITVVFTDAGSAFPEDFVLNARIRATGVKEAHTGDQAPAASIYDRPAREEEQELVTLSFPLHVDLSQIKAERVYEVGQDVTLDGQTITVERLEVYPTFMQIVLSDHEENTAWLVGLNFYLEDQAGNQYEQSGGITALGSPDSPFWPIHRVDSAYFTNAGSYTLHITGATWLDKDLSSVTLDLETGESSPLPELIQDFEFERSGDGYRFEFYLQANNRALFDHTCWDSQGVRHDIPIVSFTTRSANDLEDTPDGVDQTPTYSTESFLVEHYTDTEITFGLSYTRQTTLDTSVTVDIR